MKTDIKTSKPVRRPPCALMTASAALSANSKAIKKLAQAGFEIVVVKDEDFDGALRSIEKVRRSPIKLLKPQ